MKAAAADDGPEEGERALSPWLRIASQALKGRMEAKHLGGTEHELEENQAPHNKCRCTEQSAACWPSAEKWQALNASVGGNLFLSDMGVPQTAIFSKPATLEDLENPMWNPMWIGNQSSLAQNLGGYGPGGWVFAPSTYYVAAQSAGHIAAAVKFAGEHDLRVVVKGAGHDYLGRSAAPNSLLIWTRPLQKQEWDGHNETVTVQAGVLFQDVYTQAQARGRHFVGGSGPSVGACGGYTLGGGFGEYGFSRRNGLAAQNVIKATVITAAGEVVTASTSSNPDLFWALRGGGGGTFGVVFDMTYKTYPEPKRAGNVIGSATCSGLYLHGRAWQSFTEAFIRFVHENLLTPHWGGSFYPASIGAGAATPFLPFMYFWDISYAEADALFSKFKASVAGTGCTFTYTIKMAPKFTVNGEQYARIYRDFMFGETLDTGAPDQFIYKGYTEFTSYNYMVSYYSAYVPMADFAEPKALAHKLATVAQLWPYAYLSTGKALGGKVYETGADTSANPYIFQSGAILLAGLFIPGYWPSREPTREALSTLNDLTVSFEYLERYAGSAKYPQKCRNVKRLSNSEVVRCNGAFDNLMNGISEYFRSAVFSTYRDLFPGTGSYANEADYYEPNWQRQFWGTNYERLYEIKQKVDPTGLFVCHHCVGSEDWSADGNCFTPVTEGNDAAREYWLE